MHPCFPFSAIVGQETLKRALLLGVIQPNLGGVLIRGTKGVAKSTAARALAGLLPNIETVAGCPCQRRPGQDISAWPMPENALTITRPVPLVELPLGATEDRVLGALHLERALRGQRVFEPGLLAAANRGILYIDEVNLLPDHLVDILLDAAAAGVHRLEREGLSVTHPAQFLLIGTMNPEEGDLRPQLLDRFGLVADVADLADPENRQEAVRRRLAYEADPTGFAAAWRDAEQSEAERIGRAQRLLPRVRFSETQLALVTRRCLDAGAEGLRADLAVCRAACAWAAYQGREQIEPADVEAVAELALAHRRTQRPEPPPGGGRSPEGNGPQQKGTIRDDSRGFADSAPATEVERSTTGQVLFSSAGLYRPLVRPPAPGRRQGGDAARRRGGANAALRLTGALRLYEPGSVLSWGATLRAAATAQADRHSASGLVAVHPEDLRGWRRRDPAGCLLFFVVDASGSMAAWQRMRLTKAAILSLLVQAYRERDRIALLAFHGTSTELVLPPGRGLSRARRVLERLPVGGATPLAEGLAAADRVIHAEQRRRPQQPIWTVLLTDGRANQAVGTDPWHAALAGARTLADTGSSLLVVDTETGPGWLRRAGDLARALGAPCLPLEHILGRPLPDHRGKAV
jgi:magnesium chelatase subunit D